MIVFDMGGGTTDVTVVKFEKGKLRVIYTNGNASVGGDNIDILLPAHFVEGGGHGKNGIADCFTSKLIGLHHKLLDDRSGNLLRHEFLSSPSHGTWISGRLSLSSTWNRTRFANSATSRNDLPIIRLMP